MARPGKRVDSLVKRKRYRKLADGELSAASRLRKDGTCLHRIKCCQCGLEHIVRYELTKTTLRFRAWRFPKRGKK